MRLRQALVAVGITVLAALPTVACGSSGSPSDQAPPAQPTTAASASGTEGATTAPSLSQLGDCPPPPPKFSPAPGVVQVLCHNVGEVVGLREAGSPCVAPAAVIGRVLGDAFTSGSGDSIHCGYTNQATPPAGLSLSLQYATDTYANQMVASQGAVKPTTRSGVTIWDKLVGGQHQGLIFYFRDHHYLVDVDAIQQYGTKTSDTHLQKFKDWAPTNLPAYFPFK